MRQLLLALSLMAMASVFAAFAHAQRFPQVINPNTHEGKYSTGGVGFQMGYGGMFGGELHREGLSSRNVGGGLEAVFRRNFHQSQSRFAFGGKLDFQVGSDNDVVGTDFGLEFHNINLSTSGASKSSGQENFVIAPNTDPVYYDANESVTLLYLGFDFTINFYKSEFLETDGRRTRESWGLAMLVGAKVGMMFGDFSDLNGFASVGLDIGLTADFPIPLPGAEDLLSITPYAFLEVNYKMGVDNALIDTNPTSPTAGQDVLNDNFDLGFYSESQLDQDGNGVADYDGIAIRRHDFIPTYLFNLGTTINLTPIFVSRSGGLINNWRFWAGTTVSIPLNFALFMADYVGDSLWSSDGHPVMTFTISFGAAYFF